MIDDFELQKWLEFLDFIDEAIDKIPRFSDEIYVLRIKDDVYRNFKKIIMNNWPKRFEFDERILLYVYRKVIIKPYPFTELELLNLTTLKNSYFSDKVFLNTQRTNYD